MMELILKMKEKEQHTVCCSTCGGKNEIVGGKKVEEGLQLRLPTSQQPKLTDFRRLKDGVYCRICVSPLGGASLNPACSK
jgi:hypothetical protein